MLCPTLIIRQFKLTRCPQRTLGNNSSLNEVLSTKESWSDHDPMLPCFNQFLKETQSHFYFVRKSQQEFSSTNKSPRTFQKYVYCFLKTFRSMKNLRLGKGKRSFGTHTVYGPVPIRQ